MIKITIMICITIIVTLLALGFFKTERYDRKAQVVEDEEKRNDTK